MSNVINRGSYYQLPSKADFTGWTPGERNIYTALYRKAHGQSTSILRLTRSDLMALADIRSRVTFQAAIGD